jgi:RNA polymerase sigma-70 factor (ECF subfamily)
MERDSKKISSPENWVDEHGDALFRYAYLRLRDRALAEDLVQETLLGALRARASFAGQSAERTWLIGILKHKLADHWRKHTRERPLTPATDEDGDDLLERTFDNANNNHWRTEPSLWANPHAALQNQQFHRVLADCLAGLPPAQAQAFSLCEIDGIDSTEACKVLAVAPTNLWVMLHRARLRLRQCLENNWFGRETRK